MQLKIIFSSSMLNGFIADSIHSVNILISTFLKPCWEFLLTFYSEFVVFLLMNKVIKDKYVKLVLWHTAVGILYKNGKN